MKIEVGTDIVSVERIRKAYDSFGEAFYERFLTPSERELVKKTETAAGFWAAKEAAAKALGCGIGSELAFYDMRLDKDERGAPMLRFSDNARKRFGIESCSLSISHEKSFAIAVIVVIRGGSDAY
jgi:holo-[acyl-carrier protein] synthase